MLRYTLRVLCNCKAVWLALALPVLAAALFLRIDPLPLESIDGDELFSRRVVMAPVSQAWSMVREDLVHPPLYYALLKVSLLNNASPDEYGLRRLSLAAGAASILATAAFGVFFPALRIPALLASLLVSLNAVHIFYSQQARSYALYTLLTVLLILWRAFEPRLSPRPAYWILGALLMASLLWTHYVGALFCAACAISMILSRSGPAPRRLIPLLPLAVAALLFLPWVVLESAVFQARGGLAQNIGWQGIPGFFALKMTLANYIGIPDFPGGTTAAVALGLVLGASAFLPATPKPDPSVAPLLPTLAAMAVLPPVLLWLTTRWPLQMTVFSERHVLPSLIPALLLVSCGLCRTASRAPSPAFRRLVLAAGVLLLAGLQLVPVWRYWPGPVRTPHETLVQDIQRLGFGHLPIYNTYPYGIGEPVRYFLRGRNQPVLDLTDSPPADSLPPQLILLYRPAIPREAAIAQPVQAVCETVHSRFYSGARSPAYGTRLLVLSCSSRKE